MFTLIFTENIFRMSASSVLLPSISFLSFVVAFPCSVFSTRLFHLYSLISTLYSFGQYLMCAARPCPCAAFVTGTVCRSSSQGSPPATENVRPGDSFRVFLKPPVYKPDNLLC